MLDELAQSDRRHVVESQCRCRQQGLRHDAGVDAGVFFAGFGGLEEGGHQSSASDICMAPATSASPVAA